MLYNPNSTSGSEPRYKKTNASKKNYFLLPLLFLVTIFPLIVHQHNYQNDIVNYPWYIWEELSADFFLYWKSVILMVVGAMILLLAIYQRVTTKKIESTPMWQWMLLVFSGLVVISTLMSGHKDIALNGGYDHFEPMWVWLVYCLLTYYAYTIITKEEDIRRLVKFASIGMAIIVAIGVLQALSLDPARTTLGKLLITNREIWDNLDDFTFTFEKNRVYSTLFNPNYVGVYITLFFPITLGVTLFVREKKQRIIAGVLSALLLICLFGAQSKTGLFTLVITVFVLLLFFRKRFMKHIKLFVGIGIVAVIAFFVINMAQHNAYLNAIKNSFITKDNTVTLQGIETTDEHILIEYNNKTIFLQCEFDSEEKLLCIMKDSEGNTYATSYDESTMVFTLTDEEFNGLSVKPVFIDENGSLGCELVVDNVTRYFKSADGEADYLYLNKWGRLSNCTISESALFQNQPRLFTGRGFIWSKSIPLLEDNVLIGCGPNTFVYEFPQEDYIAKENSGFENQVITKPHNLYLQIAVQTGVLSCIVFIAVFLIYAIDSIKLYRKSTFDSYIEQIGIFLFVGVLGYMISGIINDSSIAVAPLFWIVLGTGYACNRMVRGARK